MLTRNDFETLVRDAGGIIQIQDQSGKEIKINVIDPTLHHYDLMPFNRIGKLNSGRSSIKGRFIGTHYEENGFQYLYFIFDNDTATVKFNIYDGSLENIYPIEEDNRLHKFFEPYIPQLYSQAATRAIKIGDND